MATTVEDILGAGLGPVRQTFMDTPQSQTTPTATTGTTEASAATGVPTTAQGGGTSSDGGNTAVKSEPAKVAAPADTDRQHPGANTSTDLSSELTGVENVAVTDMEHTAEVSPRQQTPKRMSYLEMYQQMSPYKPPTPEDLEKERKKQKREQIFSAIGDGISAMSNLYFTTQYAPNAFDPSKSMTATTRARWDKLKKEREANQREYMEGFMRAMQMDDAADRDDRNWNHTLERENRNWLHTLERERIADARADKKEAREEQKAEQNEMMFQLRYALQMGKLTEQGYRNAIAEVKAGKIEELTDAQINRYNRLGSGSGGKKTSVWKAYNPTTGEEITIHATDKANAWSQCPQGYQIRQEPIESTSTREQKNRRGQTTKSSTITTTKNPSGKTGGVSSPKDGKNPEGKKKTNVNWK